MKLKYYGTGGGAGVPEIFCRCEICEAARKNRGKDIRTRSQAVLDDCISLDFPVDAFTHCVYGGLDMSTVGNILITHNHYDHFMPADLFARPQNVGHPINVWASEASGAPVQATLDKWEEAYATGKRIKTSDYEVVRHILHPFEPVDIAGYTVHPLKAHHDKKVEPLMYIIEKDGKSLLWAHDTGVFYNSVWEYIAGLDIKLSFMSLDCNLGRGKRLTPSHMDIDQCADMVARLREMGKVSDNCLVYISHMGHLHGMNHEELDAEAQELNMRAAYDGLEVEF